MYGGCLGYLFVVSGLPKPVSVDQKVLFSMVLGFVQKFLPDFAATDIIWVRSMKSSKFAVLNVQCRDVPVATRVKSTFAALVKSTNKPAYIGDVSISFAHTLGTRVRISLMRAMSKRQKEKDPEYLFLKSSNYLDVQQIVREAFLPSL